MAARTPFESDPASSDQPITPESLGWQLLSALPQLPLHTISLHNDHGEALWLNEGELGADEQYLVEESLQVLGADPGQPGYEDALADGRTAAIIPVRTPRGELLGLCLIVTDPIGEAMIDQLMSPQLRTVLRKLAVIMRPSMPAAGYEPAGRSTGEREAPRRAPSGRDQAPEPAIYDDYEEYADGYQEGVEGGGFADAPSAQEAYEPPVIAEPAPRRAPPPARPAARVAPPPVARPAPPPPAPPRAPTVQKAAPPAPARPPRSSEGTPPPASRTPPFGTAPPGARQATRPPTPAPTRQATQQGYGSSPPTLPAAGGSGQRTAARPSPAAAPLLSSATVAPSFPSFPSNGPPAPTRAAPSRQTDPGLQLELMPFVRLRPGIKGRRFEVVPRASRGESRPLDTLAVQQLIGWLGANRATWSREPTSFTLNLSISTLEDERFLRDTAAGLRSQGIQGETLGFEIAETLYTQNRAQVERFMGACEKIGCFLVIDDFSLDSSALPLLRSRAVRMVKMDGKLTAALQRDKLSEAVVTASIHATRVMGVQCAAKAVESPQLAQWLKAAGCDVAQGTALGGPARLDSLAQG